MHEMNKASIFCDFIFTLSNSLNGLYYICSASLANIGTSSISLDKANIFKITQYIGIFLYTPID